MTVNYDQWVVQSAIDQSEGRILLRLGKIMPVAAWENQWHQWHQWHHDGSLLSFEQFSK
jgi:hypothetical protein